MSLYADIAIKATSARNNQEMEKLEKSQKAHLRMISTAASKFRSKYIEVEDPARSPEDTEASNVRMYETHFPGFCYLRNGQYRRKTTSSVKSTPPDPIQDIWNMPRRHIYKQGTAFRRNYGEAAMENALESVCDHKNTFSEAAEQFCVPKTTLYTKYLGIVGTNLGRPPAINAVDEKNIATGILIAADFCLPFNERNLQDFVESYLNKRGLIIERFKDNQPGRDWIRSFVERNPDISKWNSENLKRCRAKVSAEVIEDYFSHLKVTLDGVPPFNIMNYDETNITDDPGQEQVFVRRGAKHASKILDFLKTSTSVMFAAAADGTLLPPYIVYQAKYLYPDRIIGGPEGTRFNRSKNGWFDSDCFEDWFFQITVPYFRRKVGKKVIIGDNLGSHLSYKVLKECEESNIGFVFLPKNSTNLCQPLDVSVFGPMKNAWRKILREWKMHHRGVIPKQEFPSLLKKMLDSCTTLPTNVMSGFRATGIYPLCANAVLKHLPGQKRNENQEDSFMLDAFTDIMRNLTKTSEKEPVKRKSKLNIPAGRSVSVADLPEDKHVDDNPAEEIPASESSHCANETDDSIEEDLDDNNNKENIPPAKNGWKTKVSAAQDISEDLFVLINLGSQKGKKREREGDNLLVAKINKIKKKKIEVSCLRPFRTRKNSFVFPTIADLNNVELSNIKFKLDAPQVKRGLHIFPGDVI